jgi:hypothetical protein
MMNDKKTKNHKFEETNREHPSQEGQATLTPDEYQRAFARRRRTQWLAIPIYFMAVILTISLVIFGPVDEERYWWIILVVAYGGLIPMLFAIYIYPLIRPVQAPSLPDGQLVPPPTNLADPTGIREMNYIWILYKIAVTMYFIILSPYVYMAITGERFDYNPVQFLGVVNHYIFS